MYRLITENNGNLRLREIKRNVQVNLMHSNPIWIRVFSINFWSYAHSLQNCIKRSVTCVCWKTFHVPVHVRSSWSNYALRKARHRMRFPRNKAGPLPGSILYPSFLSTPTPFLHESHCLLWSLTSARRVEHSENPVSFFHYLCLSTSNSARRTASKDDCDSMEWNYLSLCLTSAAIPLYKCYILEVLLNVNFTQTFRQKWNIFFQLCY